MTLRELHEKLKGYFDRSPNHQDASNTISIVLKEPRVGARAQCAVDSVSKGFDWEAGKILIHPVKPLCVKPDSMQLYDDASHLIIRLYEDARDKNKKPWYFEKVSSILEQNGMKAKIDLRDLKRVYD